MGPFVCLTKKKYMVSSSGVSLFLLGLLTCPFILHWGLQYRHRLYECVERHYVNTDLLNHQVCADPQYRQRFGGKIDCQKAEVEMAMGRYLCAWHLWKTHDFEPYAWLVTLFNSNWLYFILFGAVLMAIWAYFQKSRDLAMQRQHMDWCSQSFATLTDRSHNNNNEWKSRSKLLTDGRRVPSARRVTRTMRRRRRPLLPRQSWSSNSSSESDSYSLD